MEPASELERIEAPPIRERTLLAWAVATGLLVGADLYQDARAGGPWVHLLSESIVMGATLVLAGFLAIRIRQERREAARAVALAQSAAERAETRVIDLEAEAERWRSEASASLQGLGQAIDQQFRRWGLTEAEAEVALLLLKGLSTPRIAEIRATSAATVRQQARSVYAKAGLAGRAELAAWFLEDLLLPPG